MIRRRVESLAAEAHQRSALPSKKHHHEATRQSTAKNVTAYLDEVPAERKAALAKLRELCCKACRWRRFVRAADAQRSALALIAN